MRNVVATLIMGVLMSIALSAYSQKADSLKYYKGSWKQALQKSKKSGKPIFADFYADYCAPCKKMDKETFTNTILIKYISKNYIPVRIDVQSFDGFEISTKYKVESMPRMLIINEEGVVIREITGFYPADNLMQELKKQ